MEQYCNTLIYAIPIFGASIIIERVFATLLGREIGSFADTISSICFGLSNALKGLVGLTAAVIAYQWLERQIGVFDIVVSPATYALTFIVIDFLSYWAHRANHRINILWTIHLAHHSSQEFNIPCAFRQEISDLIGIYFLFYFPAALLGLPIELIATVAPIHFFAQYWYHTKLIGKLGFLENVIVTPSHHRVHHAINSMYLDKNYGSVFILWDKIFGTFQEEDPIEEPVYGAISNVFSWNPMVANFVHPVRIARECSTVAGALNKIRLMFMPVGWHANPECEAGDSGLSETHRSSYSPVQSKPLKVWSSIQFIFLCVAAYWTIAVAIDAGSYYIALSVTYIFLTIFSLTSLLDVHPLAIVFDMLRFPVAMMMVGHFANWQHGYAMNMSSIAFCVAAYSAISIAFSIYFSLYDRSSSADARLAYRWQNRHIAD